MSMFCYQCEQTAQGTGCTTVGICGKSPETTVLQDLMIYQLKGISQYAHRARLLGAENEEINYFTLKCIFMTLTNVNFDEEEHYQIIAKLGELRDEAQSTYEIACAENGMSAIELGDPASCHPPSNRAELNAFANSIALLKRILLGDPDIVGLQELLTYGIKGLAAYAHHAEVLGYTDSQVYAFVHEAFDYMCKSDQTEEELLALCLRAGEVNLVVMQLLDQAHTETFGHPEPTKVRTTPVKGKCILVSGHDMKALNELLQQTENLGINVYTHGELLPASSYPVFKTYPHLAGNFGTAWQNQVKEFEAFPGPIVMTTNCLKPPASTYSNRLFTVDAVGFHGISKVLEYDFSAVIESALALPGFESDAAPHFIEIGHGRNAVLSVADVVIDAVKNAKIRHFFLVGGCDGAEFNRNYYTELAEEIPADCVIMTLGCAKYRFNMQEFGSIGPIPRLLDLGQCNDSYSAIRIASALAEAFQCDINELPLSLVLSWLEQKAVAVLLTLLYLGIKDIRLGPNLPAFVTPSVLAKLNAAYGLKKITTPADDLREILQPA